jgi:aryl carrier-like protein
MGQLYFVFYNCEKLASDIGSTYELKWNVAILLCIYDCKKPGIWIDFCELRTNVTILHGFYNCKKPGIWIDFCELRTNVTILHGFYNCKNLASDMSVLQLDGLLLLSVEKRNICFNPSSE